jgi:hypothetical protein
MFKEAGDPHLLNADYHCKWYDPEPPVGGIQPSGIRGKFKRLLRPLRIRITK